MGATGLGVTFLFVFLTFAGFYVTLIKPLFHIMVMYKWIMVMYNHWFTIL